MRLWEFITETSRGITGIKETDGYIDSLIDIIDKHPAAEKIIEDAMKKFIAVKTRDSQEPYNNKDYGHQGVLKGYKHVHLLKSNKISNGTNPVVLYYRIEAGILILVHIQFHINAANRSSEDKRLVKKLRRAEQNDTSMVMPVDDPTEKKKTQGDYNQQKKDDYKDQQWYKDQQEFYNH